MAVAFVFNCDYNGLAIIQSLGRKGISVYALDCKRSVGTFSRYSKFKKVTSPIESEEKFIQQINKLASEHKENVILFPTNDIWVSAIAKNREKLANNIVVCCPELSEIKLLLNKFEFGKWSQNKGFNAPKVFSKDELKEYPDKIIYPIALKATGRSDFKNEQTYNDNDYANFRFVICNDQKSLFSTIGNAETLQVDVFGQELVVGQSNDMYTIGFFSNSGNVTGIVFGKKIRGFPADYGDCVVGEARPVPAWARDLAKSISRELSYTGIAEIELMKDRNSGIYKMIEINPRSWSWIGISDAAGADLPWIAFNSLIGKPSPLQEACNDGVPIRYSKLLQDIQNSLLWYKFLDDPEWSLSLGSLIKDYRNSKNIYAEFHKDDPMIAIFSMLSAFKYFLIKVKILFRKP